MRLRRNRIKTYHLRNKLVKKDNEGNLDIEYGDPAYPFRAILWPAGGKLQTEQYGERVSYIRNVQVVGKFIITRKNGNLAYQIGDAIFTEGDGVCVYVDGEDKPDYKIISIKPYEHLYVELEKL